MIQPIHTARLTLRTWSDDDISRMIELCADPTVMRYFPSTMSSDETRQMMNRIIQHLSDWGYGLYAAEHTEDRAFIGFIGLMHATFESKFTPCIEIGWRLDSRYWNQGLATEGAMAVLEHSWRVLELEDVYSWTATTNTPSERVMQKLGMTRLEGTFLHPHLPSDSQLAEHIVYHITNPRI
ncbi:MAG: GNAT family N-acetyltransferase [Bacteroidota bacterium]